VVARITITNGAVSRVALLPAYIDRRSRPEILIADDPRFAEVHDYLVSVTRAAGLNGRFVAEGDQLVIATQE
jgi:hypothetical protein